MMPARMNQRLFNLKSYVTIISTDKLIDELCEVSSYIVESTVHPEDVAYSKSVMKTVEDELTRRVEAEGST